jgi:hypothetical protein
VIVADGLRTDAVEMHTLNYQRVDMASSKFQRQSAHVRFGHKEFAGGGNEFEKPESMAANGARYAGTKIPPGDFALVSYDVLRSIGLSKMQDVTCYSRGATIYRFREGASNIIRVRPIADFTGIFGSRLNAAEVDLLHSSTSRQKLVIILLHAKSGFDRAHGR